MFQRLHVSNTTPSGRRPPGALARDHHWRLKPAVRLFEVSPVGVSLTEPVTLKGPPNSFCSALSEGSHFSSVLEILAPNDTLVSVGKTLNRSDWLLVQPWLCVVGLNIRDRANHLPILSFEIWYWRSPEWVRLVRPVKGAPYSTLNF